MAVGHGPVEDGDAPSALFDRHERRLLLAFFLGLAALFAFLSGGHAYSIDDELMYQTTRGLARLDSHIDVVLPNPLLYLVDESGQATAVYGLGQPAMGVPFYVTGKILSTLGSGPGTGFTVRAAAFMTNAIVIAGVAALIVLVAREMRVSIRGSYLLAVAYAFGTFALTHIKTYGSEQGAALCTIAGCYFAIRFRRTGRLRDAALAGIVIGLAPMFRISTSLFVAVVGLYLVYISVSDGVRRVMSAAGAFGAGAAVSLALLGLANWWRFGSPLSIGYQTINDGYPILRGLFNLHFSTGKSFFMFAPPTLVILIAVVVYVRRLRAESALLFGLVAVNALTIAQFTIWSGDWAWGPRYLQVTLPAFICLGAIIVDRAPWRRVLKISAIVGFLLPALLGLLIDFNVFLLKANREVTGSPSPAEPDVPAMVVAVRYDLAWNQILGHAELLPQGVRDVLGARRESEPPRPSYSPHPRDHHPFFAAAPRLDFWWLWVEPADGSRVTYLLFIPIAITAAVAGQLWRRNRSVLGPPNRDLCPWDQQPSGGDRIEP